ncbi:MAG: PqqD family protein [Acidobacteriota bacterium]
MSDRHLHPHEDALFRRLDDDEAVVLHLDSQRYFGLDSVGARLWELLTVSPSLDAASAVLLEEFDVDEASLRADLDSFVAELVRHELLVDGEPTAR